jgi:hypothetical protein
MFFYSYCKNNHRDKAIICNLVVPGIQIGHDVDKRLAKNPSYSL